MNAHKAHLHTWYLHSEAPRSRIVLKRDLKDAYKSGMFHSSKVKRSNGSVEEFTETTGVALTDVGTADTDEWLGPDTEWTGMGVELGVQEKVETGIASEMAGKDSAASEKDGAGEAVDMLAADRGVAEAGGIEKVEPGGWGGGKQLMGAVGEIPAEWETEDRWDTGMLETWAGM